MRTLIVAASLLLTTLAFAPEAAAESDDCQRKDFTDGQLRVTKREDCTYEVAAFEDIICVGGWGGVVQRDVAGHTAKAYYCDGGLGDRVGDLFTMNTAAAACAYEKSVGIGTLYVEPDCSVRLDVKFYECIWGGHWDSYGAGPVTVRVYQCDPYPPTSASAAQVGCENMDGSSYLVSFDGSSDCHFRVHFVDGYRVCPDRSYERVHAETFFGSVSADVCTLRLA